MQCRCWAVVVLVPLTLSPLPRVKCRWNPLASSTGSNDRAQTAKPAKMQRMATFDMEASRFVVEAFGCSAAGTARSCLCVLSADAAMLCRSLNKKSAKKPNLAKDAKDTAARRGSKVRSRFMHFPSHPLVLHYTTIIIKPRHPIDMSGVTNFMDCASRGRSRRGQSQGAYSSR